ncbi:MAG: MoxR family ATPase [Candidatus Brocadiia bacterium]
MPIEQEINGFRQKISELKKEISGVIVGHNQVVEQVIISILAGGHSLMEGVPGIGKTLLVKSISQCLNLSFSRIQFTPDLMPGDITGTNIIADDPSGKKVFQFQPGPVFHNIILADEINRATPKTQSALLESMQEATVTINGVKHQLPRPFLVLATQNPIEMEGTYPLPEAQLDRFFFKIMMKLPSLPEFNEIINRTTGESKTILKPMFSPDEITRAGQLLRQVPIASHLIEYTSKLVMATHPQNEFSPASVRKYVRYGASPRGAQAIVLAAKANAIIQGRLNVAQEDIINSAFPALRHRMILNLEGETSGAAPDDIIREITEKIPRVPEQISKMFSLTEP